MSRPGWNTKVPGVPDPEAPVEREIEGIGKMGAVEITHPAFGLATITRVTSGGGGTRLYGSDFNHGSFVRLEFHTARDNRSLHKTWRHQDDHIVSVDMSELQWGQLVSSFGQGGGVPVTIARRDGMGVPDIIGIRDSERMINEVKGSAHKALEEVTKSFLALEEAVATGRIGAIKEALRDTKIRMANMPENIEFTADKTVEFLEKTVEKAKAEINAHAALMANPNMITSEAPVPALTFVDKED